MGSQTIRSSVVARLEELLDRTVFTRHGFAVEHSPAAGVDLEFHLIDYPQYYFRLAYTPEGGTGQTWDVQMHPGAVKIREKRLLSEEYDLRNALLEWAGRVQEELEADRRSPVVDLSEFRASLDEAIAELDDPEALFTEAEADEWAEKLDRVLGDFEAMREQFEITEQEVARLKSEVENLKRLVRTLPKKVWVRSTGNALARFLGHISSGALAAAAEGTVRALMAPR